MLRRPAVAGTWYPADPARLTAALQSHLAGAEGGSEHVPPPDADVVALIAPHAGLMYSGPVAACAYRLLRERRYDAMVLVGPSHYVALDGVSVWPAGDFETPLGPLHVEADLAADLARAPSVVSDRLDAHTREHSLEMQLPFLALLAGDTPIVPLVMGHQTRETAFALGDAIGAAMAGRRVLLIASSDLSHFFDAGTAASLDARVIEDVERLDPDALMTRLERRPEHACGGGPMVSVMRAAKTLGARVSRVLRYADSGDVSGDKQSVVGYLAAAAWR